MGDIAVDDLAADLRHLEPVEVTQGLARPAQRPPDGRSIPSGEVPTISVTR